MEEIEKLYLTIWHDFLPWIGKRKKRKKKRETGGFLFFGREGECGMDFFENIAQKASFGILD